MKTRLVSYATPEYENSLSVLSVTAKHFGIDEVFAFRRNDLVNTDFYKQNRKLLDVPRGGGFWLWKPYYIHEVLQQINDGDILVYSDAGIFILDDLSPLYKICLRNGGILLFHAHYDDIGTPGKNVNSRWTKRDAFVLMRCDSAEYHNARQVDGSFQVYLKNERSLQFAREYLDYCCNPAILANGANICGLGNLPDFIQHREDQSVLSLLAVKHKLEMFRHPSQFGNHLKVPALRVPDERLRKPYSNQPYMNSPYPMLIFQHRSRT